MIQGTHRELCPHLERWENKNGATVLRLHWKADPDKTEAWAEDFAKTFPGGREGWLWQREMEISFKGIGGKRIFPEFARGTHVVKAFDVPEEWPKWRVIDPGVQHAFVCLWFTVDGFGTTYVYKEHHQKGWNDIGRHVEMIKGMTGRDKIEFTLIDPSAFAMTLAAQGRTVAELLSEKDLPVVPAHRAGKKRNQFPALGDLLRLGNLGEPRFKVFDTCPNTIEEFLTYHWKEAADPQSPDPEEPFKKDDDAVDCCLYFAAWVNPEAEAFQARRKDPYSKWYDGDRADKILADANRRHAQYVDSEDD
jgi:hypothetical protein